MAAFTLHDLEKRVQERAKASAEVSYTRKLIDRGVSHCAKKLGEEAVEAALAAVGEDRDHMIAEAADVLYHLLVLLHARGISLDEKAARKSG
jgi:phosphoribosyl-ATP pyrophosphohydrolase